MSKFTVSIAQLVKMVETTSCAVAMTSANFDLLASHSGESFLSAASSPMRHSAGDIGAFAQVCICIRSEMAAHRVSRSCGKGTAPAMARLARTDDSTEAVRSAALSRSSAQ